MLHTFLNPAIHNWTEPCRVQHRGFAYQETAPKQGHKTKRVSLTGRFGSCFSNPTQSIEHSCGTEYGRG